MAFWRRRPPSRRATGDAERSRSFEVAAEAYPGSGPSGNGSALIMRGPWSVEAEATLLGPEIDTLVLNYAKGFEGDLAFLAGLQVSHLFVLDRSIEDVSPIAHLDGDLLSLSLQVHPGAAIDLSWTPALRDLSASWEQLESWSAVADQIETLSLQDYDPPDLHRLSEAVALRDLRLVAPNRLETLDGVEAFPDLRSLEVRGGRRLRDADALDAVAETLRTLRLDSCPQLGSIEWARDLRHLEELWVTNSGNIDSAEPLRGLTAIETLYLYESTRFVDGDLSAIAALRSVRDLRIAPRPHYEPSAANLADAIERRRTS